MITTVLIIISGSQYQKVSTAQLSLDQNSTIITVSQLLPDPSTHPRLLITSDVMWSYVVSI